jgi:hypothetical protein
MSIEDDPDRTERELNTHVRISASTHQALKVARRGDMTFDDVIRDALREYEPYDPHPMDALEGEA